jgi:hypothetical protein
MENLTFYFCEKCGKKLIARKPNGVWQFCFGRFSNASTYLVDDLSENGMGIMVMNPSYFSLPPFVIKLNNEEILVQRIKNNIFTDLKRGYNKTLTSMHKSGTKVREVLQDESGEIIAPVNIEIHGSLRMVCLRKNCRHINIFNYFPNTNDYVKTKTLAD